MYNQQMNLFYQMYRIDQMYQKQREEEINKIYVAYGFIVDSSQTDLANLIFKTHPETARNVDQSLNPELKTRYINVLFHVYRILYYKKPRKISDAELSYVSKGLYDLTQVGFDVEWLRSRLEMFTLVKKIRKACEVRILELKAEVKKLEGMMSNVKVELRNEKAKFKHNLVRSFLRRVFVCEKTLMP